MIQSTKKIDRELLPHAFFSLSHSGGGGRARSFSRHGNTNPKLRGNKWIRHALNADPNIRSQFLNQSETI